jgi:hypothetical protein
MSPLALPKGSRMRIFAFIFALLCFPAVAQEVDLELLLLADASGSISEFEILFQRQGYADAITDPAVLAAIAGTNHGSIAVIYVEWAANTAVVVGWTKIDGLESASAFAKALTRRPRQVFGRNAIGTALLDAKRLIETNSFSGWRKIIDFSGDSPNSYSGPTIEDARREVIAAGITINGLPILCRFCDTPVRYADLGKIYQDLIIGGPGAFVIAARNEQDLATAIRQKLILEIAGTMPALSVANNRP